MSLLKGTILETVVLACESMPAARALLDAAIADYQPVNGYQRLLVEEIAACRWRSYRYSAIETALLNGESTNRLAESYREAVGEIEALRRVKRETNSLRRELTQIIKEFAASVSRQKERGEQTQSAPEPAAIVEYEISRNELPPARQPHIAPAQTPRNAQCPCGSGAKFKRCCALTPPARMAA